jgi:hypothetical protein
MAKEEQKQEGEATSERHTVESRYGRLVHMHVLSKVLPDHVLSVQCPDGGGQCRGAREGHAQMPKVLGTTRKHAFQPLQHRSSVCLADECTPWFFA